MPQSLSSILFAPLLAPLLSLPCLLWTQGPESAQALKDAGVEQICVPADASGQPGATAPAAQPGATAPAAPAAPAGAAVAAAWRRANVPGLTVRVLDAGDLASREALTTPGITARAGLASPTRVPWVTANGWELRRKRGAKYAYDVPTGRGALAAAEAFAYGADATLKIDPADLPDVGSMLAFLSKVPAADLPDIADVAVVDDGSPLVGEVMNLLERRNLLFQIVRKPSPRYRINIALGTKLYPQAAAADPSAFELKIRHQLTDQRRTLRIYGSEVVIARLTGDAHRVRLHLLNYSGRELQGLRIRLRGTYRANQTFIASSASAPSAAAGAGAPSTAAAASAGAGITPAAASAAAPTALTDLVTTGGATEFSIPAMGTYAIIDLTRTATPPASKPRTNPKSASRHE